MGNLEKKMFVLTWFLILTVGCSRYTDSDVQVYYGLKDFGYQHDCPSPYGDWLPDGESSAYRFGLKGPHGHIVVEFLPIESIDSPDSAIGTVLGLESSDFEVLEEEIVNRDTQQVHEFRVAIPIASDASYVRIAMFEFDSKHWAVVHGQPTPDSERRFNSAFDTLLWSLEPYTHAPLPLPTRS